MKRITSMVLAAAMLASLSTTACSAEKSIPEPDITIERTAAVERPHPQPDSDMSADQRLAEITLKVKETLGIGDEYTEFSGDLWENELAPRWSLNWNREEDSISVEATEDGKITSYYLYKNDESYNTNRSFPPSFPAISQEKAQQNAESFLKKVLTDGETVEFSNQNYGYRSMDTYRFSGTTLLNGLNSPLSFSINVRSGDGKVTQFYRDSLEGSFIGGVPSPTPGAAQEKAGELLKDTLKMRLEYVLDDDDKAVLRYLPENIDDYYVDAQTGELVNLTELYKQVANGETCASAAGGTTNDAVAAPEAAADSGASLTQVELEGIAKLEGVLSKEDLNKKLQEIKPLGLNKYTLASARYIQDKESGDVSARMEYTRRDGDDTWRRTVTCDAKTGVLLGVWSSAPYDKNRTPTVAESTMKETAIQFLKDYWGDDYAKAELYKTSPWEEKSWDANHSFTFAQKENSYFLPENNLQVSVDITDGTISAFSRNWTEVKEFESPEGILSADTALDAWYNHYDLRLSYGNVPVKLDPNMNDAAPLMELGYSYFYTLKLSYALEEPENDWATGVGAKSGEIITEAPYDGNDSITYSDLEEYAGREKLEALAGYGIGWTGGKCEPAKFLTQLDFITLLVSADGYRYDPVDGETDNLYRKAYSLGILKANDRDDGHTMTRGDVVKMLLDCAGYGEVAQLSGIFSCAYPDAAQIPANLTGYAAIAQGIGIIEAEQEFAAGRNATRGMAAEMLYNFMSW